MPNSHVAIQVVPMVPDDIQMYEVIDKAIEVIANSGVRYEVGAMQTVMEGELDTLLEIVKQAQTACIDAGATEVVTQIAVHYRPGGVTIEEKLDKYRD
ncbi:thiamine-binding protein [Alicyclobacillus ferrooxydans]|uniref:Thiamine-binding protein domain-containing protein n=1 Tax=Alicyclobacillus ferrooxydans TaxID=471514 RepID=A0A0P9C921_9BACL|nr:thiamine-binding protein [Alicyclobacillus ferrooxydans]KPV41844.1 hypothetical protein AN477_20255 [Alicyclobacillus ferrooxydans]